MIGLSGNVTAEQVARTLFQLAASIQWETFPGSNKMVGFVKRERRIRLFTQVPVEQMPWFGQGEPGESVTQKTNLPYKNVQKFSWIVYHRAGADPDAVPVVANNQIIDAFKAAMEPKPTDPGFFDSRNTLSGLVHHCYIDGQILKDPGDVDEQAIIFVPITVLVP